MGWGVQPHAPAPSTPGNDPVPIVQEPGWTPQGQSGRAENLIPTGIRSPTVQSVVSYYNDLATGPTPLKYIEFNL